MAKATEPAPRPGARLWAGLVWVVTLGAMLWPVVRGSDGFPLSNYPMFSKKKGTEAVSYHVVGFSKVGAHRPMPPEMLGSDEIMQASQTAKLAFRGGAQTAARLCEQVAARVSSEDEHGDILRVEVRRDTYASVEYWQGDRASRATQVAARCPVKRGSGA